MKVALNNLNDLQTVINTIKDFLQSDISLPSFVLSNMASQFLLHEKIKYYIISHRNDIS